MRQLLSWLDEPGVRGAQRTLPARWLRLRFLDAHAGAAVIDGAAQEAWIHQGTECCRHESVLPRDGMHSASPSLVSNRATRPS